MEKYSAPTGVVPLLNVGTKKALLKYNWPGNVRELDNIIQRALILKSGNQITESDLMIENSDVDTEAGPVVDSILGSAADNEFESKATTMVVDQSSIDAATSVLPGDIESPEFVAEPGGLGVDLRKREFEVILSTLKEVSGSRKNAAERLGISTRTLRYKLAKMRDSGIDLASALRA